MDRGAKFMKLLADGMDAIDDTIRKINRKLDHGEDLSNADMMHGYTNVYNLCFGCPTGQDLLLARHFFGKFENAVKDRIREKVIPSLENKKGNAMVKQLAEAWTQHKQFTKQLLFMFRSTKNLVLLIPLPLPELEISLTWFCDMVWDGFNSTMEKAIRDLIASGWPRVHEEEDDLPSYDQFSDFIERIRTKTKTSFY